MTIVARPVLAAALEKRLIASGIPLVSLASACAGCDGHQEGDGDNDQGYPASFDVDMESDLLGTMSGYERQIVISTGKSDWQREVTEREEGKEVETLAMLVYEGYQALQKDKVEQSTSIADADSKVDRLPGIYPSTRPASHSDVLSLDSISLDTVSTLQLPSTRLSVINGSFLSSSDSNDHHSVLLFPDYISIHDVEGSKEGSDELLERYLTSKVGASSSTATSTMKSWPLPYEAVVLICSHKKRDKRCHIAAPLLISQFHHHLDSYDIEVDERGDDIISGEPLESYKSTLDRSAGLEESLRGVKQNGRRVLISKISHIGGHRYAGNVIIYLPSGASIWYGRVTPRDVAAIVKSTIIEGKVIPDLLRGAIGVTGKRSSQGVLAW